MNTAYELRGSLGARNLRKAISRFEKSVQRGNLKSALRFCEEIQELGAAMRSDLGIFEPAPKLTVSLAGFGRSPGSAYWGGAQVSEKEKVPFQAKVYFHAKCFRRSDGRISSLGSVYEMICPLGHDPRLPQIPISVKSRSPFQCSSRSLCSKTRDRSRFSTDSKRRWRTRLPVRSTRTTSTPTVRLHLGASDALLGESQCCRPTERIGNEKRAWLREY